MVRERNTCYTSIQLSLDEKEHLRRCATSRGLTVNRFIRDLIAAQRPAEPEKQ